MGIYHKDELKKERWESGQAILHRQQQEAKKRPRQQDYELKNSYGTLHYLKKDKKNRQGKEGFSLEAFEAPGTPVHTEKEKHIDRGTMKNISRGDKKALFASEVPLRNQALFYEMSGSKKSDAFLKCMKELIRRQGHRTLRDAFGFLEQEPEQLELEVIKSQRQGGMPQTKKEETDQLAIRQKTERGRIPTMEEDMERPHKITIEEFSSINRRIDNLSSRLHKKEAKERQLCSELQTMLSQRAEERFSKGKRLSDHLKHTQEEKENQSNAKQKSRPDNRRRRMSELNQTITQAAPESETETDIDSGAETAEENKKT